MSEYLDCCVIASGGGGEGDEEHPSVLSDNTPIKPSHLERGRSDTIRTNVNASNFTVEVVKENLAPEERVDASLEPSMCGPVPFLAEQEPREAEPTFGIETVAEAEEEPQKPRKRDVAPSPPRSRGQAQLEMDIAEALIPAHILKRSMSSKSEKSTRSTSSKGKNSDKTEATSNSSVDLDDDRSLSSLYDMIADAFSFVDSTASTQKASGGRKDGSQEECDGEKSLTSNDGAQFGEFDFAQAIPVTRIGSQSSMSCKSDLSEMNDELFLGLENLESVPEDDVVDTVATKEDQDVMRVPPSRRYSSSSVHMKLLKRSKGKSSKALKQNLKSLSVLVYGRRIAKHNFKAEGL